MLYEICVPLTLPANRINSHNHKLVRVNRTSFDEEKECAGQKMTDESHCVAGTQVNGWWICSDCNFV